MNEICKSSQIKEIPVNNNSYLDLVKDLFLMMNWIMWHMRYYTLYPDNFSFHACLSIIRIVIHIYLTYFSSSYDRNLNKRKKKVVREICSHLFVCLCMMIVFIFIFSFFFLQLQTLQRSTDSWYVTCILCDWFHIVYSLK